MIKNMSITVKICLISAVIIGIGFLLLTRQVNYQVSNLIENQIDNQMTDAAETRSYIINEYVNGAEDNLVAFGKSDEVKNLLLDPDNKAYLDAAQRYTVDFASVKGIFEGLYIASYESEVYTHTTEAAIGIFTRSGDALKSLQNDILSKKELTNSGIMKSPSTGNMVISMYYPVYDGDRCIGFVGGAVYANKLMDSLLSLCVDGLPDCHYAFIDVESGEYLYNENEELLCTVTEDKGYLQILDLIKSGNSDDIGLISYTDNDGVLQEAIYSYLPERGWVFIIHDTNENVFGPVAQIKKSTRINIIIIADFVLISIIIVLSILGRRLKLISTSIKQLGEMNLSADELVTKYSYSKDEVGIICDAITKTCANLRSYIGDIESSLSAMADGDFTKISNTKFVGDFAKIKDSLVNIQSSLRSSFSEINAVSEELVSGSLSVSDSASSLADTAVRTNELVTEIEEAVEKIESQLLNSSKLAADAKDEAKNATEIVLESREKMDELSKAMNMIETATKAIESISTNLEGIAKQTNILALNAVVEASRAGEAGKGFSVVANEIRQLADQSSQAAIDAYDVIHKTIDSVADGQRIGLETANSLDKIVEQTAVIDKSVSEISEAAILQNEQLHQISAGLRGIGSTIETTAAMSEQSAAASVELDGQINALRDNISQYVV